MDWLKDHWPAVLGVLVLVVLVVVVIVLLLGRNARRFTPMELLVRNLRASTLPTPARKLALDAMGGVALGKRPRLFRPSHVVAISIKPTMARSGLWAGLFGHEIIIATPSDVGDIYGRTLYLKAAAIMRYTHNLFWIHPDLEDKETRERWCKTLHLPVDTLPEALLPHVQFYFQDAVESLLSVQEQLAAMDLNARSRRSIPLEDPAYWSDGGAERDLKVKGDKKQSDDEGELVSPNGSEN